VRVWLESCTLYILNDRNKYNVLHEQTGNPSMNPNRLNRFISLLILLPVLIGLLLFTAIAGCNLPAMKFPLPWNGTKPEQGEDLIASPLPPLAETLVSFRVKVPANTPPGETVYLSILDEVTGLALNARLIPMEAVPSSEEQTASGEPRFYALTLPFAIGSVIQYRYERQADSIRVAEHLSDGSAVRYRMVHVSGQGSVDDVISRWTDTAFDGPSGRIMGNAIDIATGESIPNLLVIAGGAQTFTASDGSFLLEGLPPGTHNLVAYAIDGSYATFQQGALVAPDSTTPALLNLRANDFVKVVFVVEVPKDTPPVVPLRLAGNLYQLGNTFATLMGGMSGMVTDMPVLNSLPDGRYTVTLSLPVGADVRYKYSLGDGFWNTEYDLDGKFRLRQIVVPNRTALVEDKVDTWHDGGTNLITFDVHVPSNTPTEDFVSIQFNPLFGWTMPIPMWRLDENRWGYVLYSPLNLPDNLSYRYCRNGQCGFADDVSTPGLYGIGRTAVLSDTASTVLNQVDAWENLSNGNNVSLPQVTGALQEDGFLAGVEFMSAYNPSWKALYPMTLGDVQRTGANGLVLSPTWSFGRNAPGNTIPLLAPIAGRDALWPDLIYDIQEAQAIGLDVALKPVPLFSIEANEWWLTAPRNFAWWQVFFEQYRAFALHNADLALKSNASALILGGEWLEPALPGGTLPDGSPSGVPPDSETRWTNILGEVRSRYAGKLIWAMPHSSILAPPPFLKTVDQIYVTLTILPGQSIDEALGTDLENWLDKSLSTFQIIEGKPIILALTSYSSPDLQNQVDTYNTLLRAIIKREWIDGFVSRGYYPPVEIQDQGPSIHGKPAGELLGLWFSQIVPR
jgi:hypothetical protein